MGQNFDFNPRSPCGERLYSWSRSFVGGSDFNPRSPCGERPGLDGSRIGLQRFQSTLSLRRATRLGGAGRGIQYNFNPRSPCGERHVCLPADATPAGFQSTLSLRRATPMPTVSELQATFQSTLSLRRATPFIETVLIPKLLISIHALLAESDGRLP